MRSEFLTALFGGEAPLPEEDELDTDMDDLPVRSPPAGDHASADLIFTPKFLMKP